MRRTLVASLRRERMLASGPDGPALGGQRLPVAARAVPAKVKLPRPVHATHCSNRGSAPITRLVHLLPPATGHDVGGWGRGRSGSCGAAPSSFPGTCSWRPGTATRRRSHSRATSTPSSQTVFRECRSLVRSIGGSGQAPRATLWPADSGRVYRPQCRSAAHPALVNPFLTFGRGIELALEVDMRRWALVRTSASLGAVVAALLVLGHARNNTLVWGAGPGVCDMQRGGLRAPHRPGLLPLPEASIRTQER